MADTGLIVGEVRALGVVGEVEVHGDVQVLALPLDVVRVVLAGDALVVNVNDDLVQVLVEDGQRVLLVLVLNVTPHTTSGNQISQDRRSKR